MSEVRPGDRRRPRVAGGVATFRDRVRDVGLAKRRRDVSVERGERKLVTECFATQREPVHGDAFSQKSCTLGNRNGVGPNRRRPVTRTRVIRFPPERPGVGHDFHLEGFVMGTDECAFHVHHRVVVPRGAGDGFHDGRKRGAPERKRVELPRLAGDLSARRGEGDKRAVFQVDGIRDSHTSHDSAPGAPSTCSACLASAVVDTIRAKLKRGGARHFNLEPQILGPRKVPVREKFRVFRELQIRGVRSQILR
mmetsp:Transcript_10721/g.35431  ORF Transcript_10721/g.35431 Transcript_10721/m.35431 type:complete len:251 (+) Transcript_10721:3277-4029(+)